MNDKCTTEIPTEPPINFPERKPVETEILVEILTDAVSKAYGKNPNAYGIILYGSRSKKTHHINSDVDYVPIYAQEDNSAYRDLWDIVNGKIKKELHLATGSHDRIPLPWEFILKAEQNQQLQKNLIAHYAVLDRSSIIISPVKGVADKIRDVLRLNERDTFKPTHK